MAGNEMRVLRLLYVGLNESAALGRDALLLDPGSRLWIADSYWDLFSISLEYEEGFDVAVLDMPSSARDLRRSAEYIRRRWPDTAIVLVADSGMALDDPLYDQRVPSNIQAADLVALIDRLNPAPTDYFRQADEAHAWSR